MHILVIAHSGCGKSDLIRRIADALGRPLFGYESLKEDSLATDDLGSPIYIYETGKPRRRCAGNLAGYCRNHHASVFPEAFDRFAPRLREPVPPGSLIVLNELGPMESRSPAFCDAVMALLDGDTPVLAAVRDKDTPFLNAVRSHPRCRCFHLTPDNADDVFFQILKEEIFQ